MAPAQSQRKAISLLPKDSIHFSSLRYNQEEIKALNNSYSAEVLQVSRAKFEEIAGNYQVIHFAGHAFADLEDSYRSFLVFDIEHAGDITDELLFLDQLEQLSLKAELVVLSACQTANGDLAKGEGVISLARAATLAGANSVVSSLWLMNQQTKVGLFQDFYDHLAEGLSKDEALRLAQLDYIQEEGNNAHPFHWAGLINIGDAQPLPPGSWWDRFWRYINNVWN